jgi:uncharacterized protein with HEPN domain
MQLEAKKYLYDIADAGEPTAAFTSGKTFADYKGDAMLRSAVERKFEITGEALAQLSRLDESVAATDNRIPPHRRLPQHSCSSLRAGGRPLGMGHR